MSSFDTTLANLGVARTSASSGLNAATTTASQTLDQNAFLKLMTAQLKNQDPFKPVENEAMVAQMAQFSQLAGISEMNTTLKSLAERIAGGVGGGSGSAVDYVGRTVLTDGAVAWPRTAGGLSGAVELDGAADAVAVTIRDSAGQTLRTLSLGAKAAGTHAFDWDGTTDSGEAAGDGPFTIAVNATGSGTQSGTQVAATSLVWAPVTSVTLGDDPVLHVAGLGEKKLTAVRQVG